MEDTIRVEHGGVVITAPKEQAKCVGALLALGAAITSQPSRMTSMAMAAGSRELAELLLSTSVLLMGFETIGEMDSAKDDKALQEKASRMAWDRIVFAGDLGKELLTKSAPGHLKVGIEKESALDDNNGSPYGQEYKDA